MIAIRTLIAGDHPATRESVAVLLNSDPEIVGTAGDGLEVIDGCLSSD